MGVAATDPPAAESSSTTIRRRTTLQTFSSPNHHGGASRSNRRVCIYLVALAPFVIYQFYVLRALTTGDHTSGCTERIANKLGTTIDSVIQSSPAITADDVSSSSNNDKYYKEDRPLPFSFSACLLVKDNNVILPEWLAYHYTVLPLRRLIVAVDPLSHTDPTPILNKYTSIGMNITTWTDDSFWIDGWKPYEKKTYVITKTTTNEDIRNRFVHRQKVFYKMCLSKLKEEMRTWTIIIDTDEYMAFNHYDENEGEPTHCRKNETCAKKYEKSIRDGTHVRAKLDRSPSATVAQYIYNRVDGVFDVVDKPCIIFGRYLFVSKESDREVIQKGVEPEFNASYFHTLRYLYRAPLGTYQLGKPIVDVSRYDGMDMFNIHRPLRDSCTGNNAYVHNAAMSFRVHHYVGSWETFRQPGVDVRGKEFFNKRNIETTTFDKTTTRYFAEDANSTTWLTQFAKLVGKEKALELTQEIRIHEELKMEKVFLELTNGNQEYDWDRLNKKG